MHSYRQQSTTPAASRLARLTMRGAVLALLVVVATALAQDPIDSAESLRAAAAAGGRHVLAATSLTLDAPIEAARDLEFVGVGSGATVIEVVGRLGFHVVDGATLRLEALTITGAGADGYEGPGGDLVLVRDARFAARGVAFARAPFGPPDDDPDRPYGLGTGLVLRGAAVAELIGVDFRHHQLAAVELHDRGFLFVDDATFFENHVGMLVEGNAQLEMLAGRFTRTLVNALVVRGSGSAAVADSSFEADGYVDMARDRSEVAVGVGGRARVNFLRTTFLDHPASALAVAGTARVTARDVRVEASGGSYVAQNLDIPAVLVRAEGELHIEGGTITGNRGGAFLVDGVGSLSLVDVDVERNGGQAHTWVREGATLNVIRGRFVGNDAGIQLLGDAVGWFVEVEIAANGTTGVRLSGDATLEAFDGVVRGHDVHGVAVDGRAHAEFRGTRFEAQPTGLAAYSDATLHLEDVTFDDHARFALDLRDAAHVVAVGTTVTRSPDVASVDAGAVLDGLDVVPVDGGGAP